MTKKIREALKRVENQLTAFTQFIEDLWLLLTEVKKSHRRKRE